MAHSLSSKKRIRQNIKQRALNRARRSVLKARLRKSDEALRSTNLADAERLVHEAIRALDREANRGTLHRNGAARRKSRLARRLNALKQTTTTTTAD